MGATRSALEQIKQQRPDAVITDLVMPIVDGLDLTRALRGGEATRALPIVAVSASASEHTGQEALDVGCNRFLPKPLRLPALLQCLGELLQLEWRYSHADASEPHASIGRDSFELQQDLADELYHLAMLGDVTGLVQRATATLNSDPEAQPFCRELLALTDQFDTGAIRRMLTARTRELTAR